MKLPNVKSLLSSKTPKTASFYLALQIGKDQSKAAVWENGSEITIHETVRGKTPSEVVARLQKTYPVSGVIFGLPNEYVENDAIKSSILPQLKQISSEFALKPLGFVVIPEAIAHYFENENDIPPTAILIHIENTKLTFSLFRIGKCTKTVTVPRTESIIKDAEHAFAQFDTEEVLPSRIILYDEGQILEPLKEKLLSYPWAENDKFLHVPKIDILPWETSIEAVVFAGAGELGDELKSAALAASDETIPKGQEKSYQSFDTLEEESDEDEFDKTTVPAEEINENKAQSYGFLVEEDIAEKETGVSDGFSEKPHAEPVKQDFSYHQEALSKTAVPLPPVQATTTKRLPSLPKPHVALPSFAAVKNRLSGPRGLLPAGVAVAGVVVLLVSLVFFYPKTTVALLAEPKVIENEAEITLNTQTASVDTEKNQIPGKVYTVSVSDELTSETKGTKTVGEKAAGKVIVYNKTSEEKTLPSGTVLGTSTGLTFTLNSEVKIASASDSGESLNYGKQSVPATAAQVGPSGNISQDTEMTVNNVSQNVLSAKTEEAFSGGTEREIKVVSKEDQDSLYEELLTKLQEKAREELKKQIAPNETFLEDSLTENVVDETYDKDIGDETDNVSLALSLEFSQTAYAQEDLNTFGESFVNEKVP